MKPNYVFIIIIVLIIGGLSIAFAIRHTHIRAKEKEEAQQSMIDLSINLTGHVFDDSNNIVNAQNSINEEYHVDSIGGLPIDSARVNSLNVTLQLNLQLYNRDTALRNKVTKELINSYSN